MIIRWQSIWCKINAQQITVFITQYIDNKKKEIIQEYSYKKRLVNLVWHSIDGGLYWCSASLIAQLVKNLPAMQETPVQFLCWEDLLEKG